MIRICFLSAVTFLLIGCSTPKGTVTAPPPSHTLYDSNPENRATYLAAFQQGYSDRLHGKSSVKLGSTISSGPHLHGYADGAMLAMKEAGATEPTTTSDRDTVLPRFSSKVIPGFIDRYGEVMEDGSILRWHGF